MKTKTDLQKIYNNFLVVFIVISLVLIVHILRFIFITGFLYFYFGHATSFI